MPILNFTDHFKDLLSIILPLALNSHPLFSTSAGELAVTNVNPDNAGVGKGTSWLLQRFRYHANSNVILSFRKPRSNAISAFLLTCHCSKESVCRKGDNGNRPLYV